MISAATLESKMMAFSSPAENHPKTHGAAAVAWADAICVYFAELSVPPTTAVTIEAARATIIPILGGGFAAGAGFSAIETALSAAAAIIAAAAIGGVAVPPTGFVMPALPLTRDAQQACSAIASAVYSWTIAGGTFTVSPSPPVPWS